MNVRLAFASATKYAANVGTAAFDTGCNSEAASAGLPGTYAAWISTSSQDARDRIKLDVNDGLIILRNGNPIAISSDDLIDGNILELLNLTAAATNVVGAYWTGTDADGTKNASTCIDWSSNSGDELGLVGSTTDKDANWTATVANPCHDDRSILCFQIDP